ncbi:hypothetical protein VP01_675g4 [Puccinia sorghi]|uniref:Uncharacterized protein n=1 Tax=Puccinia sorghi TaxID=27349 RepID=A0A0L6UER5_9BASI|nr:hypothetical protein VP01_675g4 [Puccinia sorghi]
MKTQVKSYFRESKSTIIINIPLFQTSARCFSILCMFCTRHLSCDLTLLKLEPEHNKRQVRHDRRENSQMKEKRHERESIPLRDTKSFFDGTCMQYITSQVELRLKYSFHMLKKSYITFAHPIFLEIIFEFQKNIKNPNGNVLWSPFYDFDILFLCYDCIENMNKSLASEPPSIFKSTSIRTLHKNHKTLPTNKNLLSNQTFSYVLIALFSSAYWISSNFTLVGGGSLKHPPTKTHTRAWKANQISSVSQFSLFPPWNMSHSCFHSPPSLSLNLGRILSEQSGKKHNMLYIIKLISSLGYASKNCDCIIAKGFPYLYFLLNCRGYQMNLGPSSPKIRLNFFPTYNQNTTGISSVYDLVQRKHLHLSAMEKSLVNIFQCIQIFMKFKKGYDKNSVVSFQIILSIFHIIVLILSTEYNGEKFRRIYSYFNPKTKFVSNKKLNEEHIRLL